MENVIKMIDNIDSIVLESKYEVLSSLMNSYDKAEFIAEEYYGDDINQFTIFTEGWISESDNNNSNETSNFRKTNKNGKKENFLKSIFFFIPRLVKMAYDVNVEKLHKKKMKKMEKHAKELNVDLSKMDSGEQELFNAIITQSSNNMDQMKKSIKKRKLMKMGLKAGGAAIAIGGIAYTINSKGELISQKVEDFKGKITKKVDEMVLEPIKNAGDNVVDKISQVADKTVEKISVISEKVEVAMKRVCDFIKKIFNNIQKYFRISLFGYDKTDDDILCKIDVKTGSLKVTLNLDMWNEWLESSRIFIVNAAKFISREVKEGHIVKNDIGKRSGAIVDFQKEHEQSKILKGDDAESAVKKYQENLRKIFDKTKIVKNYEPISQFTTYAKQISEKMSAVCSIAKELSDTYEKRINNPDNESKWSPAEKSVFQTLRGILDTQILLTNSIDAVNSYIDNVSDLTNTMLNTESVE